MNRLNNLKIRRKLVAMAFVIIALLIGAMVIVVQTSLGTMRQAFREESDAVVVQLGENIAQTLDAGMNSSYEFSSPAFMRACAQGLPEDNVRGGTAIVPSRWIAMAAGTNSSGGIRTGLSQAGT